MTVDGWGCAASPAAPRRRRRRPCRECNRRRWDPLQASSPLPGLDHLLQGVGLLALMSSGRRPAHLLRLAGAAPRAVKD